MYRLILSCDTDDYYKFLKINLKAHKKFCDCRISVLLVSSDNTPECEYRKDLYGLFDTLHVVRQHMIPKVHKIPLCKLGLLWEAGRHGDEIVFLQGVDRIPLQSEWMKWFTSKADEKSILTAGRVEFYDNDRFERGKIPSGYCMGKSSIFKRLCNEEGYGYYDFVKKWHGCNVFDNKEDPFKSGDDGRDFSDESVLRVCISRWKSVLLRDVNRLFKTGIDSIDRSNPYIDYSKLHRGGYVEAHLWRPRHMPERLLIEIEKYISEV